MWATVRNRLSFQKTHRWTKPGIKALHKSAKKFLIPLVQMDSDVSQLYTEAWAELRKRYVESCGNSTVIDMNRAAQEMSSLKDPGSLYTKLGYQSKADVYQDEEFLEMAHKVWTGDLVAGKYRPYCDVNGKTEILEIGKDGRTVYCVDALTILFMKMLFHDQHEKYRTSNYASLWANLGKTSYGTGAMERWNWITDSGKRSEVFDFDVKKMEANMRSREMHELALLHYEALDKQSRTPQMWSRIKTIYDGMAESPFFIVDEHQRVQCFWKGANGMGGNPSGQVCTALDNSLFDMALIIFVFKLECNARSEECPMSWFWSHHSGTIMGDDLQITNSSEADKWWKTRWNNVATAIAHHLYIARGIVMETTNPVTVEGIQPVDIWTARFCGMRFVQFHKPWKHISFVMDRDRMLSSIQQGDPQKPPHHHLERFNGIRNITWADEQTRSELADWRNQYVQNQEKKKPQLIGQENWERAKAGWLPDYELYRLFTGVTRGHTVAAPIRHNLDLEEDGQLYE